MTERCKIYDDVTQTIGQTPIVKVHKLAPEVKGIVLSDVKYMNDLLWDEAHLKVKGVVLSFVKYMLYGGDEAHLKVKGVVLSFVKYMLYGGDEAHLKVKRITLSEVKHMLYGGDEAHLKALLQQAQSHRFGLWSYVDVTSQLHADELEASPRDNGLYALTSSASMQVSGFSLAARADFEGGG
eukprot:CAMPEP_0203957658 /NCGR_PEP_ID=MMETSP0359-20131031/89431_1 /ASSEMBLY_ACC=CAM_ASM_000338 /TAXON_ID=268821 /ORGANISM="Scrippsiella Hangoei, Strain SHTV-5" /LENGTH=181 /DNA_ID=CAMNT_0050891527 /DNA_START=14 /DNA_END=558 /DNA_ORIENTATION=-